MVDDSDDEGDEDDADNFEAPSSDDEGDGEEESDARPAKRRRGEADGGSGPDDRKKKLAMDISYEGFAIYGRVLCLVVKRREQAAATKGRGGASASSRSQASSNGLAGARAMVENWITSTQMPAEETDAP